MPVNVEDQAFGCFGLPCSANIRDSVLSLISLSVGRYASYFNNLRRRTAFPAMRTYSVRRKLMAVEKLAPLSRIALRVIRWFKNEQLKCVAPKNNVCAE